MSNLSEDKIQKKTNQSETIVLSQKQSIWDNILKIEALKKERDLRKKQYLCRNLQIKAD